MATWKDVKGYEGLYCVSDEGEVKNVARNRLLNGCVHASGYKTVVLYKNSISKRHLVHRLVATAFIQNINEYEQVNHIDENKLNNKAENLEWCSRKYNMNYGTICDRIKEKRGHLARRKRRVCQISKEGITVSVFESIAQAARLTGTARTSIYECCNKIHKSANGYIWEYEVS